MIKKILLTLGLFGIGFINYTYGALIFDKTYYLNQWDTIPINTQGTLGQFTLKDGLNFDTDGDLIFGFGPCNGNSCILYDMFWNNNKLYLITSIFGNYNYGLLQGYLQSYCSTNLGNNCCNSDGTFGNYAVYSLESGYSLENGYFLNPDSLTIKAYTPRYSPQYFNFCMNYSGLNITNCICTDAVNGRGSRPYHDNDYPDTTLWNEISLGLEYNQFPGNFSDTFKSYFQYSPLFGGGGFDPIPDNGFPNTNRGVFDSYAEQGYVLSRCYSDFSLDNLATATGGIDQFYETELDDGVYYTGATVLDLFVEYGYGNSFESFFDYWYQTYNQSLINDSPAKYVGLSKGLWNMSNKYYYAGLSNKYVDYTKFYNYCSYFVNFTGDWDAEYTGPQLPDDVANQLVPSQSAIDYLSGFIHNQLSSGNNQNFDADTFFTSLTTRFDRLLNNIDGSYSGLIPGYILAIMMALIFIRIISH